MTRVERAVAGSAIAILLFCAYAQFVGGNGGDKYWTLVTTRMWLSGRPLYTALFSVLPPLIFWVYAIPVSLSLHLPIADYHLLAGLGLTCVALSVWASLQLVRTHPQLTDDVKRRGAFVLLLCFIFVVWSNPIYFFDREHIIMVMIFPYLVRWMPSVARQPHSLRLHILTGCMAAIGFCLKPHAAIIFAGVQLLVMLRERSLRILWSMENLITYAAGMFYLLLVATLTPEYFHTVIPMALATYSACADSKGWIFFLALAFLLAGLTFADFRLRYTSPYRKDIFYLVGLCPSLLLYALLNNGWGYSWNPLNSMILFVTGWVLWEFGYLKRKHAAEGLPVRSFRQGEQACWLNFIGNTAVVLLLNVMFLRGGCGDSCLIDMELEHVVRANHVASFGTVSIDFGRWARLTDVSGARWDTRFNHLWMLPKFFISDAAFAGDNAWILRYVADAYAEDMNHRKPDIMIVDDTDMFYRIYHPVDLVAYLSVTPAFKEAWGHYRYMQTVDHCAVSYIKKGEIKKQKSECRYILYKRAS